MLQKIIISTLLFISLFLKLNAQTWTFAGAGGSANAENGKAICADAAGNVYVTGQFTNMVDFDLGAGVANLTSNGSNDIFIASYTSAGVYRWALRAGGIAADNNSPNGGICTDGVSVYVTGSYNGAATMFGGISLTPNGGTGTDAFVAKLNCTTGAFTWAVSMGGTGNVDSGTALCLDPSGNPYLLGSFNGTMSGACGNVSLGGSDIFVSKLNPATGACVWMASGGSATNDGTLGGGICYDPTTAELIVASTTNAGLATFGAFNVTSVGGIDMCVLELNSTTGAWLGVVGSGSATTDDAIACVYDPSTTNVMVCGAFTNNMTLPGGIPLTASSAGIQDAWWGSYSVASNGFVWAKAAVGTGLDRANGIAVDGNGSVLITGQYVTNPTTFGSLSLTNTNSGGFDDMFLVNYSAVSGTEIWATKNTNTGVQPSLTAGRGIAYAGGNNYWITGQNNQGSTFGSTILNAVGFADFFIAKYNAPVTCLTPTLTLSSQTNVLCNGGSTGSATVSATGGAPYTYTWSPSGGNAATASGLSAGVYTCVTTNSCGLTASRTVTITQPATSLSASNSVTNVLCRSAATGAINLTPAGGTSPYTFNWGGGITTEDRTGLIAGAYTCTITDNNGCTTTSNATITQPASALSASNVVTNISCFGGSNGAINLTPAGGTSPYTFNWGGGITTEDRTGLIAGAYTCTITDANGCTTTSNATVTQPASALSASNVVTNILCRGAATGAINLTTTGGTGAYTYNWGGGITTEDRTALLAGAYTCTITDANGCTTTSNATVTQPASALSASNVVTNISCLGGSNGAINLTPAGGTGAYTFLWSTGHTTEDRTGLLAGAYTCTITDANGCTTTSNATITQPASALSASNVVTNISCFGGSNGAINLTPAGGTTAYTFNWGGGITTEDRTGLLAGAYTCTITDANGCTTTSNATVTQPASALSASNVVTNILCRSAATGAINLTPAGGTTAYSFNWGGGITTEDRTGLLAGAYTCTITDANGCTTTSNATVTQPASALSASNVLTNISCFGGSNGAVNLTPAGGTGAYTFLWSTGHTTEDRTGLLAGAYTCTITDANGCTTTSNATVTQPASALSASNVVTNISCFGGSNGAINLTPTGGTGAYTFLWSTGHTTEDRTGLIAGAYTCTITDNNGCTTTSNATITQPASALSASNVVTNISCFGGSNGAINLTPAGGTAGYTFNWGGGATTEDRTGLLAGAYTCTITDANGCTTTSNATITQPATALSASNVVINISCFGGSNGAINLTPTGGTGAFTFLWSTGHTTEDRTGLLAGAYTCTITDANGCTTTSNATVTQPATALSASNVVTNISCFGGSNGAINLTPTGGTAGYTFNWGGGVTTEDRTGLLAGAYTCTITDANGCTTTSNATVTQPATALSASNVVTNISCFGGSNGAINLTPAGGTSPYTFNWGGGITTEDRTGLLAGAYTCTITDANGCTTTSNATVTQPASALSASNVVTNISCFGGSNGVINLTPTGGTGAFTFLWSTGHTTEDRTGLIAGAYTCTITDNNGCTTTSNATITQPASALSASNVVTNISCFGGSNGAINLTPAGGTAAYTFNWGGGVTTEDRTGLLAGAYTCTITDANGCTTTSNATVTQPASALSASNVVTNISCFGGSNGAVNLTPAGGTGAYTFLWSTGHTTEDRTGLLAGAYTCTITDANGCTTTSNATVTQPASALSASNVVTNISCFGGSNGAINLTPTGGTGAFTFLWSTGHTTEDRTGLLAGAYTCTITDANGCTTTSNATVTQPATALSASNVVTNISCFGGSNGAINLTPAGGTTAYTFNWGSGITTEDRTGLLAGAYTCTITDANGCTTTSNATITQPASAIAATVTSTNTACLSNTGIASVSASGGTPGYTYSWSPSGGTGSTASSLGVGNYSCVIMDANSCSITRTVNIITSGAPTATIIAQTNVTCNSLCNGSATVSASGGTSPYNYIWSNGNSTTIATNLCAGVITCTVIGSNGCSTVVNTTITQPTVLSANATASAILCNGGVSTVTVSATGGTSSYSGVGTFTTLAGTKTYTVTDANGCSTTTSISVSQPTVLSANATASAILCNGGISSITVSATGGSPSYSSVGTFTTLAGTKSYTVTDANGCSTTTSISVSEPSILSANATASSILCNGGISTITVSATGGSPSYSSVGTFTTLAGTKTYTVTDANGCSTTTSVSITEPTVLSANTVASSIICNGGVSTITVSATGGTTSYLGVGTFTANAGTQTYTISDTNGCSTTTSVSITEPSALVSSQSLTLCAGQSITVGTSTYNASGTYTNVLSAINGCDSTVTTNLIVNPAIVSSQTVTLCSGQSLTVGSNTYTATGIYTNTFSAVNGCDSTATTNLIINPAIVSSQTITLCTGQSLTVGTNTYTTTGIYTNTFTAVNGCDSTITTNLTINSQILFTQNITVCFGGSILVGTNTYSTTGTYTNNLIAAAGCDSIVTTNLVVNNVIDITTSLSGLTITANEPSGSYQWIDCDNSNAIIPSETSQNFTASANGNYAVIVTQNSCSDTSACVNISTVGIKEVNSLTGIKLYPNPTNSSFTISGVELNTTITIYNAIGELVKSIKSSDNTTIDLSEYSNGIYFIKMKNNNGEAIHKLIKN